MSKFYESPQIEIRKYNFADVTYTVSTPEVGGGNENPDLNDDDLYDPFA